MIHFKKNTKFYICILLIFFWNTSCNSQKNQIHKKKVEKTLDLSNFTKAYFASGCFWCVEAVFESVDGVAEVLSGYAGGTEKNPTYEQVSSGITGHAEAVEVYYDSSKVNYQTLLEVFFDSHDPTTLNKQGPDKGKQYRSAIFYKNENEKKIAETYIIKLLNEKTYPIITTTLEPFKVFYLAEKYHQDYEKNNPDNFYVQRVSIPRLNLFKSKTKVRLKD